jgi:hypothetical protein
MAGDTNSSSAAAPKLWNHVSGFFRLLAATIAHAGERPVQSKHAMQE